MDVSRQDQEIPDDAFNRHKTDVQTIPTSLGEVRVSKNESKMRKSNMNLSIPAKSVH